MAFYSGANNVISIDNGSGTNTSVYTIHLDTYLSFTGLNFVINTNAIGVNAGIGSTIDISGFASGTKNYIIGNNHVYDAPTPGIPVLWAAGGTLNVTYMDIIGNNNRSDVYITDGITSHLSGSYLNILGRVDGSNKITLNNNYGIFQVRGIVNTEKVTISNMDMEIVNNSSSTSNAYGIWSGVNNYANMAINGNGNNNIVVQKTRSASANGYNIVATDGGYLKITNSNITADEASTAGIAAIDNGSVLEIEGKSTKNNLRLNNNDSGFLASNGTINVRNMNISGSGNDMIKITNTGYFNLTDSSLFSTDNSNAFYVDGIGAATINNAIVSGAFITAGTQNSTLNMVNGSIWNMKKDSNINFLNASDSLIDMRSEINGNFNTLTIGDSFDGNDSVLEMNTILAGDGSPSDKIILQDGATATGSILLKINDVGGGGGPAYRGILVVDAQGSAKTNNAFSLLGGVVDNGAFEYRLFNGDTALAQNEQSLFLKNTYISTNTASTIGNIPAVMLNMGKTGMDNLVRRLGELRNNNHCELDGAWAKTYGKSINIDDGLYSKAEIYGFEAGYDRAWYEDAHNRFYIGLMAGYMHLDDMKTYQTNGFIGHGNGYAPSAGAYVSWLNVQGWFVDAVMRNYWIKTDATSYTSAGEPIKFSPERNLLAGSLEFGRQIDFIQSRNFSWFIEPKAQLIYSFMNDNSFMTSNGKSIYYDDMESLLGKFSISLGYSQILENGSTIEPYIEAGVLNEFDGKGSIIFDGWKYDSDCSGVSYEIGAGLNWQIDTDWSIHTNIAYEKGDIVESASGNLGIRYTW